MKKHLFQGKYFVGGVDDKVHFEIEVKVFLPPDEIPDKEKLAGQIDEVLTQESENFVDQIIENEIFLESLDHLEGYSHEYYVDLMMDTEVWTSEYEEIKLIDK